MTTSYPLISAMVVVMWLGHGFAGARACLTKNGRLHAALIAQVLSSMKGVHEQYPHWSRRRVVLFTVWLVGQRFWPRLVFIAMLGPFAHLLVRKRKRVQDGR